MFKTVHQWKATDIITHENAAHVLFLFCFPVLFISASCICLLSLSRLRVFGADHADIHTCLAHIHAHTHTRTRTFYRHTDPTTSLLRAPRAKYEKNCNLEARSAYCTIRGPNSDFWTFSHTVPALLESSTHY